LLPLRDTFFNRYLTFPLKLMDYVAAGLPVVARRLPTIENIVQDRKHGILLPDLHPGAVQEAFVILRDKTMYAEIQSNVRGLAQDLSWIKRAEKTLECIARAS
jgi:glycosyltransferase involved in cell wall biosynthesis